MHLNLVNKFLHKMAEITLEKMFYGSLDVFIPNKIDLCICHYFSVVVNILLKFYFKSPNIDAGSQTYFLSNRFEKNGQGILKKQ